MMWHKPAERPDSGRRIIALFDDGSGGNVFLVHDDGVLNEQGGEDELDGYDIWAYLPDDYRLFFEEQ